ncbi:MAG: hypothetical protein RLY71_1146 [Pseudomonadota bacterium]|jgi:aspartyl protease family protein
MKFISIKSIVPAQRPAWPVVWLGGLTTALLMSAAAAAQTLAMAGSMGSRAVLVIDGHAAVVSEGSTLAGVKVRRVEPTRIEVETASGPRVVALGGSQVSVGSAGALPPAPQLVLSAAPDRLYRAEALLNGAAVNAVVDTGASLVSLSLLQSHRLGLDLSQAPRTKVQTANGELAGWRVTLERVQLGRLEARRVEAVVIDTDLPYVLLGNSFLGRFRLQWQDGQLQLGQMARAQ